MKLKIKKSLVLFSFVLSSVAILADHHSEAKIKQSDHIPGTWIRYSISPEG